MQGEAWEALLRRIPSAYHDGLLLATVSGVELVMQSVVRIEPDYLIMRGRPAGSSDNGKVLIVPFRQINYVAIMKRLLEPEIQAIFGSPDVNFADLPPVVVGEGTPPTVVPPEPTADEKEAVPEVAPGKQPSKSLLLAKLRARLAANDNSKHRPKG